MDSLLNTLQGFVQEIGDSTTVTGVDEEGFTKSVQIARSITEIQANELIAINESIYFVLQDIRDILRGTGAALLPVLPDGFGQGGGRDPLLSIGSISAGVTESEVPKLMTMIEDELRAKLRGGRA